MSAARNTRIVQEFFEASEKPDAPPFLLRRFGPREALEAAPHLAPLIELWDSRRGGEAVPDWADVDFPDFRGWHSSIVVSDLPADEPDPIFRIIGEDFRIFDYTTTQGQRFSDRTPRLYERQFREHFREIRDRGLIGWSVGSAAIVGREHLRVRVLELPFRKGGPLVSRLLHVTSTDLEGGRS